MAKLPKNRIKNKINFMNDNRKKLKHLQLSGQSNGFRSRVRGFDSLQVYIEKIPVNVDFTGFFVFASQTVLACFRLFQTDTFGVKLGSK